MMLKKKPSLRNASNLPKDITKYVRGYEVHGVSPLPHFFEEIYCHTVAIPKIGPRGDQNYFWYSKDGNGAAYYEVHEQQLSAESTFAYLTEKTNREKYFAGIAQALLDTATRIKEIDSLDLASLDIAQLFELNEQSWQLDTRIFSHYLISQPYRLQLFEDHVRAELKKRVAESRVDYYLARLTASEKMTKSSEEELAWAQLLLDAKREAILKPSLSELGSGHPYTNRILSHYERFKILTLGDGNWKFDPALELERFLGDFDKTELYFTETIRRIQNFSAETLLTKQSLIIELYIDNKTVEIIEFLAQMSHVRYTMRTEGFIPLIYASGLVLNALVPKLGYDEQDFGFMTYEEMTQSRKVNGTYVTKQELKNRRGTSDEYMLRINNGKVEYTFGEKAGDLFAQLLPPVDHAQTVEVRGVSAEGGVVRDTVTVYRWGDDMVKALESVRNNPILVTGQTRPSMMPLIREAKGIITDEGGVTSHAAIVARELKIPTIINSHNGTNVFKTGECIILDATNGTARKVQDV